MIREQIYKLVEMGSLPESSSAEESLLFDYERLLNEITPPVSDDEARMLMQLFGPDDCYGLAWTLLHLIESAPNWPLADCLMDARGEWKQRLRLRAIRGGELT